MKRTSSLVVLLLCSLVTQAFAQAPIAQAPSAVGRWQIEFTFSDDVVHRLTFDAAELGKGTYLLLDRRSSLLEPAQPSKAEWTQFVADNKVNLVGEIEFPIGNVGRDAGTLLFNGTFETSDLITGEVVFSNEQRGVKRSGTFRAVRVTGDSPPRVELLSPTFGKLKRGREVDITWMATSTQGIVLQQVFLSLDDGESFTPISAVLDQRPSEITWHVPEDLPKTKLARLKVIVLDGIGKTAEDSSPDRLKVK